MFVILPNMSRHVQFKQRMTLWEFQMFHCPLEKKEKTILTGNKCFSVRKKSLVVQTKNAEWTSDADGHTLGHVRTAVTPKTSKRNVFISGHVCLSAFVSFLADWLLYTRCAFLFISAAKSAHAHRS